MKKNSKNTFNRKERGEYTRKEEIKTIKFHQITETICCSSYNYFKNCLTITTSPQITLISTDNLYFSVLTSEICGNFIYTVFPY